MKSFLLGLSALFCAMNASASGSTDYVCWQTKVKTALGSIRYQYTDGESKGSTLWKVAGVDQAEVENALLKWNEMELDPSTVIGLLTKSDETVLDQCWEDDQECLATENSSEITDSWTVVENKWKTKVNHVEHVALRKSDKTKITLVVENSDSNDYDSEYRGTLKVESPIIAYSGTGTIPVNCKISTP